MAIKAFLFDLDGTLIDSEGFWSVAILAWLKDNGAVTTKEELFPMISGRSWNDIHASLHEKFNLPDTTVQEDSKALEPYFREAVADLSNLPIPSAVEFFKKASDIAPCAIVSGSPRKDILQSAELCGISDKLTFAIGGDDYLRGKPYPDCFLMAADLLGVRPEECLVIEDSWAGVSAGVNAGMNVLWVDRHPERNLQCEGYTWKVSDLSEFDLQNIK